MIYLVFHLFTGFEEKAPFQHAITMYCYHHSILSLENALRRTIRLLYLTAARPGRGNGAYVEDILHIENLVLFFFFILGSFHSKACKTLLSSCQCNLVIVDLQWLKFVNIKKHNKNTFHTYTALKYLQIWNISCKRLICNDAYLVMLQIPRNRRKYNNSMESFLTYYFLLQSKQFFPHYNLVRNWREQQMKAHGVLQLWFLGKDTYKM